MSHRTPGSDTWELAVRSKQLWEELAAEVDVLGGGGARERLGWMRTGKIHVMVNCCFFKICLGDLGPMESRRLNCLPE